MRLSTLLLASIIALRAQLAVDPQLSAEIAKMKAVDNHTHIMKYVAEGEPEEHDYDALPCDALEPSVYSPLRLRNDNPEYLAAWRALYGYQYRDASAAHLKELAAAKQRAIRQRGAAWPTWVLDQIGTEILFANRIAMGAGLESPRFRWVPYDDALLFPLNNDELKAQTPDRRAFFAAEERLLQRYLKDAGLASLPANFDDYLKFVTATLEKQRQQSAVAIKFEAAYLRSIHFAPAAEADARSVYQEFARGGQPPRARYTRLQDFLFRHMAREAGRLKLAMHIHSAPGCGDYFQLADANPLLLESVLNDAAFRGTNFVIVHGGWPWHQAVATLLGKPNVYADISEGVLWMSPRSLAEMLREYLTWYPEKVLYGSDLGPVSPEIGWEETGWVAGRTARQALGAALTTMMKDGMMDRPRALAIAKMVLRENAFRLYGL